MVTTTKVQAYKKGYNDFTKSIPLTENPFPANTDGWFAWNNGQLDAKKRVEDKTLDEFYKKFLETSRN